jgi:hypothetical protein
MLCKLMKNVAPFYLCRLVQRYSSGNLRSNELYYLPDSQFIIRNNAFSYVGPSQFNAHTLSLSPPSPLSVR